MKLTSLADLYLAGLQDMYNAEKQLTRALPKMAKAAQSPELRSALQEHLAVTQQQMQRLEGIITNLGKKPGGHKCAAMQGLVEEGQEVLESAKDESVRDAGIIMAGQKVEHYEIASYGSLATYAELLGRSEDKDILGSILEEEKQADQTLNRLAEGGINQQAADGAEELDEE